MSDQFQDVLGQLPVLKSYTHILLCFALSESSEDTDAVIDALQSGVRALIERFPFLAGRVVHRDIRPGNSGRFMVEERCSQGVADSCNHRDGNDRNDASSIVDDQLSHILRIKRHPHLSYKALHAASFPSIMLPASMLAAPRPAFPESYSDQHDDGDAYNAPVLDIQANFVQGGLLLDIATQHNIIDATGMFQVIRLLGRSIRYFSSSLTMTDGQGNDGEKEKEKDVIPHSDIIQGNRDRRHLIPLLDDNDAIPETLCRTLTPPCRPPPLDPATLARYKWHWVYFSPVSVKRIHEEANARPEDFPLRSSSSSITQVSVNDAITAFCWKSITNVRVFSSTPGKGTGTDTNEVNSQISRALDLRRSLSLTPAYMGHMVRTANMRLPISTIRSASLSYLAGRLRQCARDHATLQSVREYATLIARTEDKRRIAYAGGFNPRTDFSCSSIAHVRLEELDFGAVLGKTEALRRPNWEGRGLLPGGMYIGPGRGSGLDGVVCLEEIVIEKLKNNRDQDGMGWGDLVEYIG